MGLMSRSYGHNCCLLVEELQELEEIADRLQEISEQVPSEIVLQIHECADRILESKWQIGVAFCRMLDHVKGDD